MISWIQSFLRQKSGVSSVEFALIAPLMIAIFLGMIEISDGLTAKRKVASATSTAADLVGRTKAVSSADIADVYSASKAILEPYNTTAIEIRITSVIINLDGTTQVGWSDALNTSTLVVGDPYVLPPGIGFPGGSVIISEVAYAHMGLVGNFLGSPHIYSDIFYMQPRRSLQIQHL